MWPLTRTEMAAGRKGSIKEDGGEVFVAMAIRQPTGLGRLLGRGEVAMVFTRRRERVGGLISEDEGRRIIKDPGRVDRVRVQIESLNSGSLRQLIPVKLGPFDRLALNSCF